MDADGSVVVIRANPDDHTALSIGCPSLSKQPERSAREWSRAGEALDTEQEAVKEEGSPCSR